jgi:sugar fermentation stimulation protein A
MKFPGPLLQAELIRRYKRFLADVRLPDGTVITAHCPNPGSMMGLAEPGTELWLSESADPKRKLRYGIELVRAGGAFVGVHTGRANAIVAEALAEGAIPEFSGYATVRREAAMGTRSRVDFLLEGPRLPICYLEVKSVTLRRGEASGAEFPDAATERGARHLAELSRRAKRGDRAVILYLVQRGDCGVFRLAADIDPAYAEAAAAARKAGVAALCYACAVSPGGIRLDRPLPMME